MAVNARAIVVCVGGALIAAASATAQHWGTEKPPHDGVCFYEDADYGGRYFCARTGENLRSLPSGMNDRISSFRIYGRAEVEIFKSSNYGGDSERFDFDVRNLRSENWNDKVSSLRVRTASSHGRRDYDSRDRDDRRSGYSSQDADRIVRRAYRDILDRDPDSAGLRLYRNRLLDDGWSESQVREALRSSPEYRQKNTMTRQKAEQIVRDAYLAVLDREPDAGSRTYVDKVLRDKWTQRDVERELRKSPEYRNKH
jgi:hypothetical protein